MRRLAFVRSALFSAVALVALLSGASSAFAATFTGATPLTVASTQSVNNVTLAVDVSDSVTFYSATLKLDGASKSAYLERPVGYWDGDGCDMWWVSDDTKGRVRYTVPSLSVGTHTAEVTVRNSSGVLSSYSWIFEVRPSSVSMYGAVPSGGAVSVWNPEIGVWADGLVDLSDGPVVTVDGIAHAVPMLWGDQKIDADTWNDIIYNDLPDEVPNVDFTKGWIAWRPSSLADGHHRVSVAVNDATGRAASTSWEFDIAAPPTIASMSPKDGSLVPTQAPEISVVVKDNDALSAPKMYVDGVLVTAKYDPSTGKLSWTPSEPLTNDVVHRVHVEAVDNGGLSSVADYDFTVQIYGDMPVSSTCEDCHDPAVHPMSNCDACHAVVPQIGHGLTPAPASRCTQCHHVYSHGAAQITPGVTWGGGDEPQPGYTGYWGLYCDWCHTPSRFPTIPAHPGDNAAFHDTTADISTCSPCHVKSLTREHARHSDAAGAPHDCDTCHGAEASAQVKAAVAAGDTRCASCHTSGGSGATHPHPAAALEGVLANGEKECTACHSTDLVTEHDKATSAGSAEVCDTCHEPGGPREQIQGAWDRRCDTAACHAEGSVRAIHENWCLACHGPGQPDFAVTKTDFSAPDGIDSSRCAACHGSGIQKASIYPISPRRNSSTRHLNHQAYDRCAGCHYLPDNSDQLWRYSHFATTAQGSFVSSISPSLGEGLVHEQHVSGSVWRSAQFSVAPGYTIVCGNCHASAGCGSCHDVQAFPATHANHVAAPNRTVAVGSATYIGADTRATEVAACAAAGCHAPEGLADARKVVSDSNSFSYEGTWTAVPTQLRAQNGSYQVSSGAAGEKVTINVNGPGRAVIFGAGNADGGVASVLVDGQLVGTADCYQVMTNASTEPGPRYGLELYQTSELGPGSHTIQLVATGSKAPLSGGTRIYIDAVWTYPARDLTPACTSCHKDRLNNHW